MKEARRIIVPPPAVAGAPVRAEDFNKLRDALLQLERMVAARTPAPSPDIGHRYGPGGFTSFLKKRGGRGGGTGAPLSASIVVIPDTDPVEYGVKITPGYVLYQNAGANESEQGATGYLMPKMGGVALDDPEVEPLELPALVSYVYLRIRTDSDGVPKFDAEGGPVTIEAFDAPQESVHHVRKNPSSGQEEGDYFHLLLETESNGATPTPAPRVKRRITGNRELPNQLVEIENLGDLGDSNVRPLYEGYDPGPEDKHKLRTLKQLAVRGEPIIKPLDDGEQEGDSIPFKSIAERATGPQVRVTTEEGGEVIKVEGNGYDAILASVRKFSISVADGLVTDLFEVFEDGDNFNIKLLNVSITETGGETYVTDIGWGTGGERRFYVRGGALSRVDDGAAVDEYEVISRIEGETYSGDGTNQSGTGKTEAPDPEPP